MQIFELLAVASGLALIATGARADDTAGVLRAFDLIGTLSSDCSKDIERQVGGRVTYALPPEGRPTITIVTHLSNATITTHQEILSAVNASPMTRSGSSFGLSEWTS